MNKGQEILYKQNLDVNIDRLLAQRRLYSNAKIMQYILIAITVIIPVLIAFITNFSNLRIDDTSWIYTIYAIVVIFGEKILEIFIDRNKKTAASIQEKFDTNIFDIPENELLNSVFIDHDIVRKYSKKDKLNANKISRVTNWYSTRIDCLQTNIEYVKAGRESRGVKTANFAVLRNTRMPAVLTEIGFISNRSEERFMNSRKGQKRLARSISNAFIRYRRSVP